MDLKVAIPALWFSILPASQHSVHPIGGRSARFQAVSVAPSWFRQRGEPVPEPLASKKFSGHFMV